MQESIRCGTCRALLFKAAPHAVAGMIEIKCRRCKSVNHLRPVSLTPNARQSIAGDNHEARSSRSR